MTDLKTMTLRRLEMFEDGGARRARQWLQHDGVIPLTDRALEVKAGDVRTVWRVRLDVWKAKGSIVEGATELLAELIALRPQVRLEQFSFVGPEKSANVFFRKSTREYLGTVLY